MPTAARCAAPRLFDSADKAADLVEECRPRARGEGAQAQAGGDGERRRRIRSALAGRSRGSWRTVVTCRGVTRDGKPCGAKPRPGTDLCPWHSADLAERRREWSRRGGINSSNRARARKRIPDGALTTAETLGLLGIVFKGVIAVRVEPGVGTACATIARAMNDLVKTTEIEERIRELEQAAGIANRRRGA